MKVLLDGGADPNNGDKHGRSSLHHAAGNGNTRMVKMLMDKGADPNIQDTLGESPLHYAARTWRNKGVLKVLLNKGAYPTGRTYPLYPKEDNSGPKLHQRAMALRQFRRPEEGSF